MQLNTYTALIGFFIFFFGLDGLVAQNENDVFDLRYQTSVDCAQNELTATLQIKALSDTFRIGTSSILFNYDASVLEFLGYESINFDEDETVDIFGQPSRVWDSHRFNNSLAGIFNLTLLLELAPASRPVIGTDWTDIGKVQFKIKNLNASPKFNFDIDNTNFNRHTPNDGTAAPQKGTLQNFDELLATQCACTSPIVNNDTLIVEAIPTTINYNILGNDVVSNPSISIQMGSGSGLGVASVTPNGILSYDFDSIFCDEISLRYTVCNDGDSTCCAEGIILLQIFDTVAPTIIDGPSDISVSCDSVPTPPLVSASDNSHGISIVLEEAETDKGLSRTWTATDVCGNQTTHTQQIELLDTVAPTIFCPNELTINCSALNENTLTSISATATDNCTASDSIRITFVDEEMSGICDSNIIFQINRVWTAMDQSGNFSTCLQLIKVIDNQAPTIICPDDLTLNCGTDITPEALGSLPTAFDSCSQVTLSFSDNSGLPDNCEFDQVTIERTWVAEDACGHKDSCVQKLYINGNPCPDAIQSNKKLTTCADTDLFIFNEIVKDTTLDYTVELPQLVLGVELDKENGKLAIDNPFGCETRSISVMVNAYDENQCLVELIDIEIVILPKVIGTVQHEGNGSFCNPKLILECPDVYTITWKDNQGNTGDGATYPGTAGIAGFVTFYVQPTMDSLQILPCAVDSFFADFSCPTLCPGVVNKEISTVVCAETTINIVDYLGLDTTLFYVSDNGQINGGTYNVGNPFGCEIGTKAYQIKGYDNRQCLVEEIEVKIEVFPAIYAGIISDSGATCEAELFLECPENFMVVWTDSQGNSGEGTKFVAQPNTTGTVTFTVISKLVDSLFRCHSQSFVAEYDCISDCPPVLAEDWILTVCGKETVNFYDYLDINPNVRVEAIGIDLDDNGQYSFESDGCSPSTKGVEFIIYDENGCPARIAGVAIAILPEIDGKIEYLSEDDFCNPKLVLECPDNYKVTWKDNLGREGTGNVYAEQAGTSGFMTFYVEAINDEFQELPCAIDSFSADFSCPIVCPETVGTEKTLTVCAETKINFFDFLEVDTTLSYVADNEQINNGQYEVGNPFGCDMGTKSFEIKGYNRQQCLIEIINLKVTVIPAVYADIDSTTDVTCRLNLNLECPDNYFVSWEDSQGNSGEGTQFVAQNNTSGTVTFTVEYLTDIVILSEVELGCFKQTFTAAYDCQIDCPPGLLTEKDLTICGSESLNVFEFLDLSRNAIIETSGFVTDSSGNFTLQNDSCGLQKKEIGVIVFDENNCPIQNTIIRLTILPELAPTILYSEDSCQVELQLDCLEDYTIIWEDGLGNQGTGNVYSGTPGTSGMVTFNLRFNQPISPANDILDCLVGTVKAEFNCVQPCTIPEPEVIELFGCHGEVLNLFDRLALSDNFDYAVVGNEEPVRLSEIKLENNGTDCQIGQSTLIVEVRDASNCVVRLMTIVFYVMPAVEGNVIHLGEGCGVQLELNCPDLYNIFWETDQGEEGSGAIYEATIGNKSNVTFTVAYKDQSIVDSFENKACLLANFYGEIACCNPRGTACDDNNPATYADQEDGECGCFGTPCSLEYEGKVVNEPGLDCGFMIELTNGELLEALDFPEDANLVVGQKIVFSYLPLDGTSLCGANELIQIICSENICPAAGTPCSDGDLATINDAHDGNCNCVGETAPPIQSEIDLRFRPTLDCESNTYCVSLQAKAQMEDFALGSSSILFNYNADALEFSTYNPEQFDETATCIGGTSSPWDEQTFDATSVDGKFSLVLNLKTAGVSCPEITTTEWETIGILCFDIMDNQLSPELIFDTDNSGFNSSATNDGTNLIPIGKVHNIESAEALICDVTAENVPQELKLKAFLQGPFQANRTLMRDDLRKKEYIPLTEPYTGQPAFVHFGQGGNETTTLEVLRVNGSDAIVDWVFIELRTDSSANSIVTTRAALIQRDGDIVDVDGVSPLQIEIPDGNYFICIKHRNHLGVMTATPQELQAGTPLTFDFTDPNVPTYGRNAQFVFNGKRLLWGGNSNPDRFIILAGGGLGLPDRDMIFFDIFLSLWYANPDRPITYNSVLHGYYNSDTNLDGKVKYQGPKNDIDAIIFFNVLFHPDNTQYRLNFAISEQIP